ncbi:MAG: DUF3237 domain-containing protein [Rhodobiaceae bacterium]|nr:DUF3237 domain-containing protein [Rhodobiaceae bacterium]
MSDLETEFLFQMRVKLAAPLESGTTPNGHRMVCIGSSGTIDGPRLKGRVLPYSGGDWAMIRGDGTGALDVRLSLQTDDGAIILMTYFGRMVASEENFAYALDFSKPDDPDGANRYYFRTNPLFETGDERYAWLNHIVTIGKGRTGDDGVIYDIYEVK